MDQAAAVEMYQSLARELTEVESELGRLTDRAGAIQKVMFGLRHLFPEAITIAIGSSYAGDLLQRVGGVPLDKLLGRDLLRAVMSDQPERWFTATEIRETLEQNQWRANGLNAEAVVRKWLRAAHQARMVGRRHRDGRTLEYRWLQPGESFEDVDDQSTDEGNTGDE